MGGGQRHQPVTPFFSRVANLTREPYNGLPFSFPQGQKGMLWSRLLALRCDVSDLKTLEKVPLKLSLPS
jgi:hypothetical protein